VYLQIDGQDVGNPDPSSATPTAPTQASYRVTFDSSGGYDSGLSDDIVISNWQPLDTSGVPNGALQPNNDESGIMFARYSNGQALILGQVALADFSNEQGLTPLGDTAWAESFQSGPAVVGAPLSAALGSIQSGALEDSNVELAEELVSLIIAQRNYQANARTIETANEVTQTIINLR